MVKATTTTMVMAQKLRLRGMVQQGALAQMSGHLQLLITMKIAITDLKIFFVLRRRHRRDQRPQKPPKMTVTHLRNMENPPTSSYQAPLVQPEELRHSTRIQRVPVPDDDNRYSRTSYGSPSAHKSAGEMSVARGEARGCDEGGNVTQVTNVTEC